MQEATAEVRDSFGMNTEVTYRVFGEKPEEAIDSAMIELTRLENKLSRYIEDSEISRINQSAGRQESEISAETMELLSLAIRLSVITQGLFDVTIGPLVDLWDYKHSHHVPEKSKILTALSLVNYCDLRLNLQEKKAGLNKTGQSIDLGGIGKGYASDRCIEILKEKGISSAFVNIGGNVSTLGNKPDGSLWSVGIRHPRQKGCLLGAVKLTDKAVVTSGDYERYFIDQEGKRRHHILNPNTGYPSESVLISATVIADRGMIADALSTAIFMAGIEKGIGYLQEFPGTEAILMDHDQKIYISAGLKEKFQSVGGMKIIVVGKEQVR